MNRIAHPIRVPTGIIKYILWIFASSLIRPQLRWLLAIHQPRRHVNIHPCHEYYPNLPKDLEPKTVMRFCY